MTTTKEELLEKAKTAEGRSKKLDREARLARADYHTLVRRAQTAGTSAQELQKALGITSEKVQEILNGKSDAVCTFCGSSPSEVAKLVAGPNVFICDGCANAAEQAAAGKTGGALNADKSAKCSFCGKSGGGVVSAASGAAVCGDCLKLVKRQMEAS